MLRGALYVDGFNLYHPIDQSGDHHLKWVSLWRLGEILCETLGAQLVKVVFCTAVPRHLPDARDRHNTFNSAQRACNVEILKGHHVPEPDTGSYSEKQSDINVALSVILDGIDDVYDVAFLLSADSDQVATARVFAERLSPQGKRLIGALPLSRSGPIDYTKYGVSTIAVTHDMLERCVLPATVPGAKGLINRPAKYDPPAGWLHPDERPKHKAPKSPKRGAWSKPTRSR